MKCLDWNLVGSDDLIGSVEDVELHQLFEQVGTEQCYSQPSTYSLYDGKKDKDKASTGELTMHVTLEEHKRPKQQQALFPSYMLDYEKFLRVHVQPPRRSLSSSVSLHLEEESKAYVLDVCLLGIRGLTEGLRHASIEVIVNQDDQPSVVDHTLRGGMSAGAPPRQPHQSKRLYVCTGDGRDLALSDFAAIEQELRSLSKSELRRRAKLAGVAEKVNRITVDDVLAAYRTLRFYAVDSVATQSDISRSQSRTLNWHPKCLTVRIWHKPDLRASRFAALHQPAELFAEACIPLIRRDTTLVVDDEVQEKARKAMELYRGGMALLQAAAYENAVLSGHTPTLLHPSEAAMQEICSEINDSAIASEGRRESTSASGSTKNEMLDEAHDRFEDGKRVAMEIPENDQSQRQKLMTKLATGQREVQLQHQFGKFAEPWSRGREQLEGTWENSGSAVSHAALFPSWNLFSAGADATAKKKKVGSLRCAFRVGTVDGESAGESAQKTAVTDFDWQRTVSLADPHPVIVRVYVLRGTELRSMDRNNQSDPYVTCSLEGMKGTTRTRQIRGDRSLHKNETLNPEFRQVFEFDPIVMPGRAKLRLRVKDWDAVTLDDDIGYTDIFLEHRYFCNQWSKRDLKPVETRELTRGGEALMYGNGSLQLWVDIIPVRPGLPLPPVDDIKLPEPERFQLRAVVWNAEEMQGDNGKVDDGGGTSMNDLYFSGHMLSKANKKLNEQKQETDTHWRAKEGKGEFNWRFVYDFEVDQQLPVARPCSFTLKAWDRDPIQFKSDLLGTPRHLKCCQLATVCLFGL